MRRLIALATIPLVLAGCAASPPPAAPSPSSTPSASPAPAPLTAAELASQLDVVTITGTFEFTEENDPNELLGRPNGYTSATVIIDSGSGDPTCVDPGAICGATIEVFEDAAGAQRRSDYILGLLESTPMLGSEYHFILDNALLRVDGSITPTVAAEYGESFGGEPQQ